MVPIPPHLAAGVARLRAMQISAPPSPWRQLPLCYVGGATDVGFAPGQEDFLVVSHAGRGLFDGSTGTLLARDPDATGDWMDVHGLEAEGVGPLAGIRIRVAGIHGGGLSTVAPDGWVVEDVPIDWPEHHLLLRPPYRPGLDDPYDYSRGWLISVEHAPVAWGFSPTGKTLLLATSERVLAWSCADGR